MVAQKGPPVTYIRLRLFHPTDVQYSGQARRSPVSPKMCFQVCDTLLMTPQRCSVMPTVQYFIAMYRTGVTMQYHWALIVTEGGFPFSREYIRMFDIKLDREEAIVNGERRIKNVWNTHHKDVILGKSSSFMGLVAFPPYTDSITTRHSVEEFLEEQPAIPLEDDDFSRKGRLFFNKPTQVYTVFFNKPQGTSRSK